MKIFVLLFALAIAVPILGQVSPTTISPNLEIKREIEIKAVDTYTFSLAGGQFVRFDLDHKNVDPNLIISDGQGHQLHQVYFEKLSGSIAISFIAQETGDFKLTVRHSGRSWENGSYRLIMHAPHLAADDDRERVAAEKDLTGDTPILLSAPLKSRTPSKELRRNRLENLQRLLGIWQKEGDQWFEQETWHEIAIIAGYVGDRRLKQDASEKLLALAQAHSDFLDEAWAYYHLADLAMETGDTIGAEKNIDAARERAVRSGIKIMQSEVLNKAANFYSDRAQFEKSRQAMQQVVEIHRVLKDEVGEAKARVSLAILESQVNPFYDVKPVYREALKVFEAKDAPFEEATILRMLGSTAADDNNYEEAEKSLKRALDLMTTYGEPADQALCQYGIGLLKFTQGKLDDAAQMFEQAYAMLDPNTDSSIKTRLLMAFSRLELTRQNTDEALHKLELSAEMADRLKIAKDQVEINSLLSALYIALGQMDQAMEAAQHAKAISEEVHNRAFQAVALNAVGRVYHLRGDFPRAIDLFTESLKLAKETNETRVELLAYQTLGAVFYDLSDFESAKDNTRHAIDLLAKMRSKLDSLYAKLLLAQIEIQQNNFEKATTILEEVASTTRDTKIKNVDAHAMLLLGGMAIKKKEFKTALEKFTAALEAARTPDMVIYQALGHKGLADALAALGQFPDAQSHYEQALIRFRQLGSPTGEIAVFEGLMNLENKKGNPSLAIFYGKQSVGQSQSVRGTIQGLELEVRKSFLSSVESTYRTLAKTLIDQNRLAEAFQILTLLKAEEYYQYTRRSVDGGGGPVNSVDYTAEEKEAAKRSKDLGDQIIAKNIELKNLALNFRKTSEREKTQAAFIRTFSEINSLNDQYSKYLKGLSSTIGKDSNSVREVTNLQTRFWQDKLSALGAGTVLLTTLVSEDKYYVLATTANSQFVRKYEISERVLHDNIKELKDLLKTPYTTFLPASRKMYDALVRPIEDDLVNLKAKNLLWSLDGPLRYLPVSALNDGRAFLVEKYMSAVVTLAQPPTSVSSEVAGWKALGAGATKGFEYDALPLPGVEIELKNIIRTPHLKGRPLETGLFAGKRLMNLEFNRNNLEKALKERFDVVHIATHFELKPGKDIYSELLFGDKTHMTLAELRTDKLFDLTGVDLLTVSACSTADMKDESTGAEIESFGVIAQKRGAKAALITLWSISDAATPKLMTGFYRNYKNGAGKLSKAEALRQAQLTLLHSGKDGKGYSHPAFWAPFIVVGEWQ